MVLPLSVVTTRYRLNWLNTDLIWGIGTAAVLPSGGGSLMTVAVAFLGRGGSAVAALVTTLCTGAPLVLTRPMRPLAAARPQDQTQHWKNPTSCNFLGDDYNVTSSNFRWGIKPKHKFINRLFDKHTTLENFNPYSKLYFFLTSSSRHQQYLFNKGPSSTHFFHWAYCFKHLPR